jgi:rubrerythrin
MSYKFGKPDKEFMKKPSLGQHCDCFGEEICPDEPCLILLRNAASAEREAIAFYLEGALAEGRLADLFTQIAANELLHYVETMRLISRFDPVQAEYLEEEGLDYLVLQRPIPKWPDCQCGQKPPETDDLALPPEKNAINALKLLTRALADEFAAINQYQSFMTCTDHTDCQEHFCHLMNEEKAHVAEISAAIFRLSHNHAATGG